MNLIFAVRVLALVALANILSACAAYHSMPPPLYSASPLAKDDGDRVVRLVFDQNGNIYPPSPNIFGLPIPPQAPRSNRGFDIQSWYVGRELNYNSASLVHSAVQSIRRAISDAPTRRVVILIKGYNNSYARSEEDFVAVRQWLRRHGPTDDLLFVQVYWDSLYRGPGTAPAPIAYFGDSMTYSNRAGMCGLRAILDQLPQSTPVTFLTHSRGAAVALAAISNPLFDRGIGIPCSPPPLPEGRLTDAVLVAFAPAIGDGHMRERDGRIDRDMYSNLRRIYVGFNPNDYATSKSLMGVRLGGRRGGDTRLGSDDSYFTLIAGGHSGRLQRESFTQRDHAWQSYLSNETRSLCLMWAGRLVRNNPGNCVVGH